MGYGRSVWPESTGLHARNNGTDNGTQLRKEKLILETVPQYRLRVATHPHDDGIPSNRTSSSSGEYVPAPCTHRPSNHSSRVQVSFVFLDNANLNSVRWVKSSQGNRRGTCGWITSFYFSFLKNNVDTCYHKYLYVCSRKNNCTFFTHVGLQLSLDFVALMCTLRHQSTALARTIVLRKAGASGSNHSVRDVRPETGIESPDGSIFLWTIYLEIDYCPKSIQYHRY